MRPLRCSRRFGFHGISTCTSWWQWRCRSMPSEAASVASRMRTGLSFGSARNAAFIRSRSSVGMPPYNSSRRSCAARPWAASSICSQFCVARYSVKMITRSSVQVPLGRTTEFSHAISRRALLSGRCAADPAHVLRRPSSFPLRVTQLRPQARSPFHRLVDRILDHVVFGVLLVDPADHLAQDAGRRRACRRVQPRCVLRSPCGDAAPAWWQRRPARRTCAS